MGRHPLRPEWLLACEQIANACGQRLPREHIVLGLATATLIQKYSRTALTGLLQFALAATTMVKCN